MYLIYGSKLGQLRKSRKVKIQSQRKTLMAHCFKCVRGQGSNTRFPILANFMIVRVLCT